MHAVSGASPTGTLWLTMPLSSVSLLSLFSYYSVWIFLVMVVMQNALVSNIMNYDIIVCYVRSWNYSFSSKLSSDCGWQEGAGGSGGVGVKHLPSWAHLNWRLWKTVMARHDKATEVRHIHCKLRRETLLFINSKCLSDVMYVLCWALTLTLTDFFPTFLTLLDKRHINHTTWRKYVYALYMFLSLLFPIYKCNIW